MFSDVLSTDKTIIELQLSIFNNFKSWKISLYIFNSGGADIQILI